MPENQQEQAAAVQPAPAFKLTAARQKLFEQISADIAAAQAGSSQYALFDGRAFNALCDKLKWTKVEDYKASLAQFSKAHVGRYELVSESGDQFQYRLVIPEVKEQRLAAADGFFDGDVVTIFRNQLGEVSVPPAALQISVRKTSSAGLLFWVCTQTKKYGDTIYQQGSTYYKNYSLPYKVGKITVLS